MCCLRRMSDVQCSEGCRSTNRICCNVLYLSVDQSQKSLQFQQLLTVLEGSYTTSRKSPFDPQLLPTVLIHQSDHYGPWAGGRYAKMRLYIFPNSFVASCKALRTVRIHLDMNSGARCWPNISISMACFFLDHFAAQSSFTRFCSQSIGCGVHIYSWPSRV